ncbi:MAG: hypothetical protein HYS98_05515, partial [Deltaproteobacteria bacterium]|nr:hypothetical protein [Deltaproteobacteria bacterium]
MNLKQVLTLNGFTQLTKGHPWLRTFHFKKSCALPKVPCVYPLGEHWFLVSPQSLIPCRRLGPLQAYWPDNSHAREMIVTNEDFLYRFSSPLIDIFTRCYETKKKLVSGDGCFRWLFSENDGIPGLIVDCIGTDIMAQIGTAPIEYFWPALQQILKASLENSGLENFVIHASRDMPSRTQEGLEISHLELEEK